MCANGTHAAYISEIDQGGPDSPAGQGIELSGVAAADGYSLLIMDASPYSASAFGRVLDVVHLPASLAREGVLMMTDKDWPGEPGRTARFASLSSASGDEEMDLRFSRLLVVMQGVSSSAVLDQPTANPYDADRYDAAAVTDWLVIGGDDLHQRYATNGYDIEHINTTLGIDLLTRLVDRDIGRVIGRTNRPDQAIDMDELFAGDPNAQGRFQATTHLAYTYTPSQGNVPLVVTAPEPASFTLLAASASACAVTRRRRNPAQAPHNCLSPATGL